MMHRRHGHCSLTLALAVGHAVLGKVDPATRAELQAADEPMVRHYAIAIAPARAAGVSHPLVAQAVERLVYFSGLFGETRMGALVTQTKDPTDPSGSRYLTYTEGMFR
jgi:hypothetical protein